MSPMRRDETIDYYKNLSMPMSPDSNLRRLDGKGNYLVTEPFLE
jgi:hypothetical protein